MSSATGFSTAGVKTNGGRKKWSRKNIALPQSQLHKMKYKFMQKRSKG